jgi:hypothetical protein
VIYVLSSGVQATLMFVVLFIVVGAIVIGVSRRSDG